MLWLAVSPEGVSTAQLQFYTRPLGGRRIPRAVELRVLPGSGVRVGVRILGLRFRVPRAVELRVLPGWGLGLGLGWVGVGVKVRVRARVRVRVQG